MPPVQPSVNDINLTNLIGIRNELARITDYYHDIAKKNKTIGKELGNILADSQKLNRILSQNEDIEARIGTELISQNKAKKFQKDLQAQIVVSETKLYELQKNMGSEYNETLKKMRIEKDLQDQIKQKMEQISSSNISMAKKRAMLVELAKDNEASLKRESILEKNRGYVAIELLKEQVRLGKQAVENAKTLQDRVAKGNEDIRKKNWMTALWKRPLAVLGIGEKVFESFKQFGVLGGTLTLAAMAAKKIVELMFAANQQVTDIRKGFNASVKDAQGLRKYFKEASNILSDVEVTQQDILNAQKQIADATGITVIYSKENLNTLAKIQETVKLSSESVEMLARYSNISGKSFEEIQNTILGTSTALQLNNKISLDNRKILEKTLTVSADIVANLKGSVKALASAVTQAQLLGTSLESVEKSSAQLLDFETSISSQLEAELLTSRHITLERARSLALAGDTEGVMKEITKQAGTLEQFNKMNRIQQEGLAKALGYSRGELFTMLAKQKEINALRKFGNYDNTKSLAENYELLKKAGVTTDQMVQSLGKIAASNLEAQSNADRFRKTIERIQEIIANIFKGDELTGVITSFASRIKLVAEHGFKGLFMSIADEKAKLEKNLQEGGVKPQADNTNRVNKPNPYNPQVQSAPVAQSSQNDALLQEMRKTTAALNQIANKNGNVYIDSRAAGTAFGIGQNVYA